MNEHHHALKIIIIPRTIQRFFYVVAVNISSRQECHIIVPKSHFGPPVIDIVNKIVRISPFGKGVHLTKGTSQNSEYLSSLLLKVSAILPFFSESFKS